MFGFHQTLHRYTSMLQVLCVDQQCWLMGAPTGSTYEKVYLSLFGYSCIRVRVYRSPNLASHVTWPTASGRTSVCADKGLNTCRSMRKRNISTHSMEALVAHASLILALTWARLFSPLCPHHFSPSTITKWVRLHFSFGVSAALHWLKASVPPSPQVSPPPPSSHCPC